MVLRVGLEAERQGALQRLRMAFGDELITGGTAFGLRALRGKQVTEAGRATDQLALGGQFEALGNGLFGLLHVRSWRKQRRPRALARGISARPEVFSPPERHRQPA